MIRKGLLISAGTIGGLGAVLLITPPHFSSPNLNNAGSNPAPTPTKVDATPVETKSATPTKKATATKKATTPTKAAKTPAPKPTTASPTPTQAQSSSAVSGTFIGDTFRNRFGPVQVQITIVDGKITAATALQFPNNDFRSSQISKQAIPYLVQETLQAQSAKIQGVGGASYTSYGWYQSLQSALAKAGMK